MSQATGERDYERPATHGRGSMRRPVTVERRAIDLHPDGHDRRRPRHCRRTSERERQGERKTPGCSLERMSGHLHERIGTHSKAARLAGSPRLRSEEQKHELQSLMRHSYAVLCMKKTT